MKLPIYNFDAKTGVPCFDCRSRLEKGEISNADVESSKVVTVNVVWLPGGVKKTKMNVPGERSERRTGDLQTEGCC
jgi:hypothetical protein